jgi:hypothetical protein
MLCNDVKPGILAHLSLLDSARAAATSREFLNAYRVCLAAAVAIAEERRKLLTHAKEFTGAALFTSLVVMVQRPFCGLPPPWEPWEQNFGVIDLEGAVHKLSFCNLERNKPKAVVDGVHLRNMSEQGSQGFNSFTTWRVLWGALAFAGTPDGPLLRFKVLKFHPLDVRVNLELTAHENEAAVAVGFLLAVCTGNAGEGWQNPGDMPPACQNPPDMPAGWQFPVTVTLRFTGLPTGAMGKEEAERLVAPLKDLAETFSIDSSTYPEGFELAAAVLATKVKFPLGHLRVLLLGQRRV